VRERKKKRELGEYQERAKLRVEDRSGHLLAGAGLPWRDEQSLAAMLIVNR